MWPCRSLRGSINCPIAQLTVYESRDPQRVRVPQRRRKKLLRHILIRNRSYESSNGGRSDRSGARVGCRRIGPAMNDRTAHFDASWITIYDHASDGAFERP